MRTPSKGFLRLPQIIGDKKKEIPPLIPISRATWWAGVASGRYPKPVKLSKRTTAWRAKDIRELIESLGKEAE